MVAATASSSHASAEEEGEGKRGRRRVREKVKEGEPKVKEGEPKRKPAKQMIAGAAAGAISKTMTAPLARMTILFQVKGMPGVSSNMNNSAGTLVSSMTQIVKKEGFFSLWKGNAAMLLHRVPYSGVNFYVYEAVNSRLKRMEGRREKAAGWKVSSFLAGAVSGCVSTAAAYPLDLLRTRLAVQSSQGNLGKTFLGIVKSDGIAGLYRGLGATMLQVSPCIASSFWSYELVKESWRRRFAKQGLDNNNGDMVPAHVSITAGAVAGLFSSTVTYPLDLARRRVQVCSSREIGAQSIRAMLMHITSTYRKQGIPGLYSGILAEYYKVVPGMAITYFTYELMKNILHADD